MAAIPFSRPHHIPKLTTFAWVVTLLISTVPDILWTELGRGDVAPLTWAKMGLLFSLAFISVVWGPLRPLRNYFIAMLAFLGLFEALRLVDFQWPALQNLFGGSVFDERMQAEQTGKLVVSLGMVGVLLLLGLRRRDFFLTRGNLRAPITPVRLLGFPKAEPWPSFGIQWAFYIALALGVLQYLALHPSAATIGMLLPLLPSILFYAALNAFNEEMTYRAPMLATLEPVNGSKHALWMSASFFGIAHYFGTPGGILGAVASIFMGWILGKAMLETRGLFWAWWIHFLSDAVIFAFLALALLS